MKLKSLGLLMFLVVIVVVLAFLVPNMKSMKVSTAKRNVISNAKIYGDEVKTLWNSDAIYCDDGTGLYKSTIAIPHEEYYVVVGKNDVNQNLPLIKLDKVDSKYYGYVKIDYKEVTPKFSVYLTDGKYSVMSDQSYSTITKKDVKTDKLAFTFESTYRYCKTES